MPPRRRAPASSETKEILRRVKAMEKMIKNIPTTNLGHCIDFSALAPGKLPNPFTVTMTARTVTFSTTSPLGLEIKPIPMKYNPGLRIPSDLTVILTPPAFGVVEVEVSSYASLSWQAYDNAGALQPSVPAPPAPSNIGSHAIKWTGTIEKIEFVGQNEECIKQICC
jgi:hypothetical protein